MYFNIITVIIFYYQYCLTRKLEEQQMNRLEEEAEGNFDGPFKLNSVE